MAYLRVRGYLNLPELGNGAGTAVDRLRQHLQAALGSGDAGARFHNINTAPDAVIVNADCRVVIGAGGIVFSGLHVEVPTVQVEVGGIAGAGAKLCRNPFDL